MSSDTHQPLVSRANHSPEFAPAMAAAAGHWASPPNLSVILPTHNPHAGRLARTVAGLRAQTLPPSAWELVLVDNASRDQSVFKALELDWHPGVRVVREEILGLTAARRRGFNESHSEILVLVDDDNVLAPDYLATVLALFAIHPGIGAMGGRSLPEFEILPPAWVREFDGLIACRDLGAEPLISEGLRPAGATRNHYPAFAPIGAGMALRREAVQPWLTGDRTGQLTDRRGSELTSGGDNDIVLHAMQAGWEVAYFPELSLAHLIPSSRFEADYLARLNRGIQKSWMQVLARHGASPWAPLTFAGACLRKLKAWFSYRAWSSTSAYIRWQGACGHFDGRVAT